MSYGIVACMAALTTVLRELWSPPGAGLPRCQLMPLVAPRTTQPVLMRQRPTSKARNDWQHARALASNNGAGAAWR